MTTGVDSGKDTQYAVKLDTASSPLLYVGLAPIGSVETDSVWQIKRIDVTSGIVIKWANGDQLFNSRWDQRTILTYS